MIFLNHVYKNFNQAFQYVKYVQRKMLIMCSKYVNIHSKNVNQTFVKRQVCIEKILTMYYKNNKILILYLKNINQPFLKNVRRWYGFLAMHVKTSDKPSKKFTLPLVIIQ